MTWDTDVRHVLSAIRVPTLIVHRTGDQVVHVDVAEVTAQSSLSPR
jgi:hypothetical protein